MWMIAGHEIVLTGSHDDPTYWSAAFVLRCYGCPGGDGGFDDSPVWSSGEHWNVEDREFDFEAAITAVIDHTGPVGANSDAAGEAALFMARMSHRLEPGLSVLEDVSTGSDAPE